MEEKFDCSGWATRNDIECSDGRTIRKDAFKDCDGKTVPVVYQHNHDDLNNVLGHALLENRNEGVYTYIAFNDTPGGKQAKEMVRHGDLTSLSIYANKLKQVGGNVMHGVIREVSLVLAGANIGAYIDCPVLAHGEESETEATIYTGEPIAFEEVIEHSDKEETNVAEEKKNEAPDKKERTVKDVVDSMTEEQKNVMLYLIGQAMEDAKKDGNDNDEDDAAHSDMEEENMKHNVFDDSTAMASNALSHSDEMDIIADAKKCGSFRQAMEDYAEENNLQHDELSAASGFTSYPNGATPAGVDVLFPEWHDVRPGAPELITDDLNWVDTVLKKVNKSPFSRIRTSQVDIRGIDALRAKGYKKGNKKGIVGNYSLARRTTDPQTVYVKSALNRDDVVDITDFDYVAYQYSIDRMQLNEELATAILIGDGREDGADGKIEETHIRPIWTDDDLYTIHKTLDIAAARKNMNGTNTEANFGDNYIYSEAMIATMLDAMITYRGSGNMDMFATQEFFNKMLLAKDLNGRRIYSNKSELATALNVNGVYPVSKFANKTRTVEIGGKIHTMKLLAIIYNLRDYSMGSTKGGEITHFTDFDIDFNQLKSLLETRLSGANTRVYSAIVIEEDITPGATTDTTTDGE
jgi:hypothetical protein